MLHQVKSRLWKVSFIIKTLVSWVVFLDFEGQHESFSYRRGNPRTCARLLCGGPVMYGLVMRRAENQHHYKARTCKSIRQCLSCCQRRGLRRETSSNLRRLPASLSAFTLIPLTKFSLFSSHSAALKVYLVFLKQNSFSRRTFAFQKVFQQQ